MSDPTGPGPEPHPTGSGARFGGRGDRIGRQFEERGPLDVTGGREHGDRGEFLARLRDQSLGPLVAGPHPPPPAPGLIPEPAFKTLDGFAGADPLALLPVFTAAAVAADARVHAPTASGLSGVVGELVRTHGVTSAVVSADPEAQALVPLLVDAGVTVHDHALDAAATADLGVTGAVAGVAATGSVVVDADRGGGRGAGLLPRVHLCVLPLDRLVATPSDILRRGPRPLPSNRVLVTGPSRTGDIEQIITLGVHGPTAVEILVLIS